MGIYRGIAIASTVVGVNLVGATGQMHLAIAQEVRSELFVAYPPADHQTTAERIFFIGTAPVSGVVTLNNQPLERSTNGHFAPSFPLELGVNEFTLIYQPSAGSTSAQTLNLSITRLPLQTAPPTTLGFAENSLFPPDPLSRQPGEWLCFAAIAPPQSTVTAQLQPQDAAGIAKVVPLAEKVEAVALPPNQAVLTYDNTPIALPGTGTYEGCTRLTAVGNYSVNYRLTFQGDSLERQAPGSIEILDPDAIAIATVTAESGTARTGPSTDYSRLTPLPKGTQARVTGTEGEWLRLDYGAWMKASETTVTESTTLPHGILRSVRSQTYGEYTEIVFPLEVPVPFRITQGSAELALTLYNTISQTDTIYLNPDPILQGFQWEQSGPTELTYRFALRGQQQWGYETRYENRQLILSLQHPPQVSQGIQGLHILLDPGHGSENDLGSRGPTGYPEKDVTLKISLALAEQLRQKGAIVSLTREGDDDLWPHDRVAIIEAQQPDLALSLHYNALPDQGDAEQTQGIGTFWYHPQAYSLAQFLHDYLVNTLDRPSYGVFWNNLALTRPTLTPAVLLELGFMINPQEFEWIMDDTAQTDLVEALAEGIEQWFQSVQ